MAPLVPHCWAIGWSHRTRLRISFDRVDKNGKVSVELNISGLAGGCEIQITRPLEHHFKLRSSIYSPATLVLSLEDLYDTVQLVTFLLLCQVLKQFGVDLVDHWAVDFGHGSSSADQKTHIAIGTCRSDVISTYEPPKSYTITVKWARHVYSTRSILRQTHIFRVNPALFHFLPKQYFLVGWNFRKWWNIHHLHRKSFQP